VVDVHDLHIWGMSTTETALTAHLVLPEEKPDDAFYQQICHEMNARFKIGHVTLQVESGDPAHPCQQAPEAAV
jgi:cobalt-zinc-cadmium efflux system protein